MADLIYDEQDKAKLRFSEAVLRVWQKRSDLGALVMQAHRDIVAKKSNRDPFISFANLDVAISMAQDNPNDPSYDGVRLKMIAALLHVWYRIPPDLQSMVMTAVRDVAILRDKNVDRAMNSAHQIIGDARSSGTANEEQLEAVKLRHAQKTAVGDGAKLDQLRKRLKREKALGARERLFVASATRSAGQTRTKRTFTVAIPMSASCISSPLQNRFGLFRFYIAATEMT